MGDHGRYVGANPYEFAMSFVQTPGIIYCPALFPTGLRPDNFGGQVDILATVMGLLRINYYNNTFGKDLLSEKKDFVFFNTDDKIGYVDRDWFFFNKIKGDEFLFRYTRLDVKNYLSEQPQQAREARKKLFSVYQTAQWMVQHQKTMLKK